MYFLNSLVYLFLKFQLQERESVWIVPTAGPTTFVFLRAFFSWHHWVVENKNRKAAAALEHRVHCCQMTFSLWKKRLAQKVEADRRFRRHIQQITADALWRWHSCWQSELPHLPAALVSAGQGCCGNGWDGESPASGCRSVHCSSGMAHTSSGVSECLHHLWLQTGCVLSTYTVLGKEHSQFLMENCLADESGSELWSHPWGRMGKKKRRKGCLADRKRGELKSIFSY